MTNLEKIALVQKQFVEGETADVIEKSIKSIGRKFEFEKKSLGSALFFRENA
jgi:hypothetical protein